MAPTVVPTIFTLAAPAILGTFGLTYDRMGVLVSAGMLGNGAAALVAGVLLDVFAVSPLARITLLIAGAACVAAGLAPAWGILGAAMFVCGAAIGVLTVLTLVLLSDLYPADRSRVMARWQMVAAMAGVAAPPIVGLLLQSASERYAPQWGWRVLMMACAPAFIGLLALAPHRLLGKRPGVASPRLSEFLDALRRPIFLSVLVIGMLHSGADSSAYMWIILLVKERFGVGAQTLGLLGGVYSLAYVLGRLARATMRWPLADLATIAVGAPVGAVILVCAIHATTLLGLILAYAGAGLCFCLTWPSILGYVSDHFPERAGTVLGAVSAVGGPGAVVVSGLTGVVSRYLGGIVVGMLVPAGAFFSLGIIAALAHLRSRHAR